MGDNGRFDCIFVHLRDPQWHSWAGNRLVARNPQAQLVVCGDTLGAPLFSRESFIQGVKWRTFVGKAPLQILSFRAKLLCVPRKILVPHSQQHAFEGKGFAGFTFFSRLPWKFFFLFMHDEEDLESKLQPEDTPNTPRGSERVYTHETPSPCHQTAVEN